MPNHVIPVTYSYQMKVYPHSGDGMIQGRTRTFLARSEVLLEEADPAKAPVVAILGLRRGEPLALRAMEGVLYRPLFAPGSYVPCTVDAFATACQGARSWLDDPFHPRDPSREQYNKAPDPLVGKLDIFREHQYRKSTPTALPARTLEVEGLASQLAVIDGIVHRPCHQAMLLVKTFGSFYGQTSPNRKVRLAWRLDDLESDDHPETGPTTVTRLSHSETGKRTVFHDKPWRRFGLADLDAARLFVKALADRTGAELQDPANLLALAAPELIPAAPAMRPRPVAEAAYKAVLGALDGLSRASVLDWLDAREALARDDARGALAALASVQARDGDHLPWRDFNDDARWALAALLRHDLVDRHWAERIALEEADEDAFAGLDVLAGPEADEAPGMSM